MKGKRFNSILMTLVISLSLVFMLFGCLANNQSAPKQNSLNAYERVRVIDGCEYIEHDEDMGEKRVYSLTHKGNCNSKVHELHELR